MYEYVVIVDSDISDFEKKVSDMINDGFSLVGSIHVITEYSKFSERYYRSYHQAMMRIV